MTLMTFVGGHRFKGHGCWLHFPTMHFSDRGSTGTDC